ncbi:hypothetical protein B0H13DRAFT_2282129 [Mycena leptocephala]|nr:hypothetical protein B0H13DRAFT_2282129 [Mycena leptocephala]
MFNLRGNAWIISGVSTGHPMAAHPPPFFVNALESIVNTQAQVRTVIFRRTFDKVMPDTGEARKCDDMTDLSSQTYRTYFPGSSYHLYHPHEAASLFPRILSTSRVVHRRSRSQGYPFSDQKSRCRSRSLSCGGTTLRGRPQDTLSFSTANGAGVDAETTAPRSQCNSAPYLKIPSCILYRVKKSSGRRSGRQGGRWWPKTVKFAIWRLAVNSAGNVAAMADKPHIGHLAASR